MAPRGPRSARTATSARGPQSSHLVVDGSHVPGGATRSAASSSLVGVSTRDFASTSVEVSSHAVLELMRTHPCWVGSLEDPELDRVFAAVADLVLAGAGVGLIVLSAGASAPAVVVVAAAAGGGAAGGAIDGAFYAASVPVSQFSLRRWASAVARGAARGAVAGAAGGAFEALEFGEKAATLISKVLHGAVEGAATTTAASLATAATGAVCGSASTGASRRAIVPDAAKGGLEGAGEKGMQEGVEFGKFLFVDSTPPDVAYDIADKDKVVDIFFKVAGAFS